MAKTRNKYYNPNPKKNEVGDCVVRAMCKATGRDWDSVFIELCEIGLELKCMPNDKLAWHEFLDRHDFKAHSISIKRGSKRPTVSSFSKVNKKGTFVLQVANHIVTVVDGYYYDIWDCGNSSLYKFWEKV